MSSAFPYDGHRQRGSVLLVVLLLLWAMSHYLLAGAQTLNHQSQWTSALLHGAQRHADARAALLQAIEQIKAGRPPAVSVYRSLAVEVKNLTPGENNPFYLLLVRHQDGKTPQQGDWFLQAAYGGGMRAVWPR